VIHAAPAPAPLRLTASGLVALDAAVTLTPENGLAPAGR
jgi:hypothetical protein